MRIKTSRSLTDPGLRAAVPPDAPYLPRISSVEFRPVFILGEERSGTTILYKLLGLSESFNVVTLYHVLCYDEILANHVAGTQAEAKQRLNDFLASRGLSKRLVDNVPVNADLPEEYRFFFPLARLRQTLCPATRQFFEEGSRKVQFAGCAERPLLLKNPADTANFLNIHRLYSQSKFVFIDRHPIDRLNSKMSMVRNCLDERNPYVELMFPPLAWVNKSWWTNRLARLIVSQRSLARSSRQVRRNVRRLLPQLPPETYLRLRYEDLCREPQKCMQSIFDFLAAPPQVQIDYAKMIDRRPRRWLPEIEAQKNALCRAFGCGVAEDDYPT
jgi:hypothetical protein